MTRALALAFALAVVLAGCGHQAGPIPDDALLPLPQELVLAGHDEGGCGNGGDFECGRVFLVTGPGGAAQTAGMVVAHLEGSKGWRLARGRAPGDAFAHGCRRGGEPCVRVEPVAEDLVLGAKGPWDARLLDTYGVNAADERVLRERGVVVDFGDCCGDGFGP